jgi:hypothetical protein
MRQSGRSWCPLMIGLNWLCSRMLKGYRWRTHLAVRHRGPWPIHNGFNHQPTQNELRALRHQDVTPDAAREIDRLCDQLPVRQ